MASAFSHIAIPLGLRISKKSFPWAVVILGMVLSVLPDADVLAFRFGIPYESQWGHRGFTHSISFAFLLSLLLIPLAKNFHVTKTRLFWVCFISLLSHSVLDAFTNGGLGVALLWPLNDHRYFAPIRPIQVSPIGVRNFFTLRGLIVIGSELVFIWLPSLVVAFSVKKFSTSHGSPST